MLSIGSDEIRNQQRENLEKLKEIFHSMGKVLVAFSGGVDSTFLLKVARDTLGETMSLP